MFRSEKKMKRKGSLAGRLYSAKRFKSSYKRRTRRPVVRKTTSRRRIYKRRRSVTGPSRSITVKFRSTPQDIWLNNPSVPATDYICGAAAVKCGNDNTIDNYQLLTNYATGSGFQAGNTRNVVIYNQTEKDKYDLLFERCILLGMWFKYTPALTEGSIIANATSESGSGVNGRICFMATNDFTKDAERYPATGPGLQKLMSHKQSTTVDLYKKYFKRFKPLDKVNYTVTPSVGGEVTFKTPIRYDGNSFILDNIKMMMMMEVPKICGLEQSTFSPGDGTNFPAEGNSVCIGSVEMGCTVKWYRPII
uniref:Capsid protein n=1 Tax=Diporeia sp. associated circular virus TaxID=1299317 RepID=M1T033_9VIRU|nr:hypothetical protein [Diporeia sp. associated circular virus]